MPTLKITAVVVRRTNWNPCPMLVDSMVFNMLKCGSPPVRQLWARLTIELEGFNRRINSIWICSLFTGISLPDVVALTTLSRLYNLFVLPPANSSPSASPYYVTPNDGQIVSLNWINKCDEQRFNVWNNQPHTDTRLIQKHRLALRAASSISIR